MSYLLGMSFDLAASPSIKLKAPQQRVYQHRQPFGWGIAWYPEGDQAAVVIKDPTAVQTSAMGGLLKDWKRFRSSVFLSHIQGAAKRRTQQDTHPFTQSYARRTWMIAHTGDLAHDFQGRLPFGDDPEFEPIGRTDSEWAFCWLLTRIKRAGARTLGEVGWEQLHEWFSMINEHGTGNFMLTDGLDLVVYRDKEAFGSLHFTRLRPPHAQHRFENEALVLDLDDPMHMNQTMCLFSTTPLSKTCAWTPLEPGSMVVARRGAIRWTSTGPVEDLLDLLVTAPAPEDSSDVEAGVDEEDVPSSHDDPPEPQPATRVVSGQGATTAVQMSAMATRDAEPEGLPPDGGDMSERHRVRPAFMPEPRIMRVVHETTYRYEDPIELSTHVLRLRPVHDHYQRILDHSLTIEPSGTYSAFEDVFGNYAARVDFEEPYAKMRVRAESLVSLQVPTQLTHSFTNYHDSIPLVWMPWDRDMMHPYLLPPELPSSQLRELSEYAMSFVERQDHDLVETLLDINETIYRDYAYVPGSTTLATTPFDVYVNRRGVCQDFANLFICLARLLNIPARYRVGYIFTGASYENTIQSEASHAWAELYLPLTGWRGFDPTNGCLAGQDHVRVACGRNYRDATPTSGTIYRGGGGETLKVDVRVEEVDEEYALESE